MLERKPHYQLYCPTMTRRKSITVTSLDYSTKVWDNKACQLRSEKCSGGKLSKVRITCMAAANAFGNEIPMFVIGKAPKPRCFKNAKFLPCRYRHKKNWMDGILSEEWVPDTDRKFSSEEGIVALVKDNSPAHLHIENLKSMNHSRWSRRNKNIESKVS